MENKTDTSGSLCPKNAINWLYRSLNHENFVLLLYHKRYEFSIMDLI